MIRSLCIHQTVYITNICALCHLLLMTSSMLPQTCRGGQVSLQVELGWCSRDVRNGGGEAEQSGVNHRGDLLPAASSLSLCACEGFSVAAGLWSRPEHNPPPRGQAWSDWASDWLLALLPSLTHSSSLLLSLYALHQADPICNHFCSNHLVLYFLLCCKTGISSFQSGAMETWSLFSTLLIWADNKENGGECERRAAAQTAAAEDYTCWINILMTSLL